MSAVRWIKLSTDLFNDEKIRYIEQLPDSDSILTIWVKLLVLAGQKNMGGEVYFNDEIPYTDEMLSAIFHRKVNTVRLALETFCKLRMIELSADKTIIICNWAKHQSIEGLDKIRQQTLERVRRHRLSQPNRRGSATRNVTKSYSVTPALRNVTPLEQSKNKKREDTPTVPEGTDADVFDFNKTKQLFNDLFGRKRAWSDEEDVLLAKLLPISRDDQQLIQWGYALPRDAEGWALVDGDRSTKPKHSLIVLLREFGSELDKWRGAKKQAEGGAERSESNELPAWPEGARDAAFELYGNDIRLPERFHQLPWTVQCSISDHLKGRKVAA